MPKVQEYLSEINSYLANWIAQITVNTALTYFDINKISEGTSLHLLNLLYGYQLVDLNERQQNFAGVDLGDNSNAKLAFQITSRTDVHKITSTLEIFLEKSYLKEFTNGVRFLLLSDKTRPLLSDKALEPFKHFFDPHEDILLIRDLLLQIEKLYYKDPQQFEKVRHFLEQEFGEPGKRRKNGLLRFESGREKIHFYKKLFVANQVSIVKQFVPFEYIFDGQLHKTENLYQQLLVSEGLIIYGPSGCGKSALAREIAVRLINNVFPVIVEAKYYETNLIKTFDHEVNAYGFDTGTDFLANASQSGQQVLLIVDGINECKPEYRSKLLMEVKRAFKDRNLKLIITCQFAESDLKKFPLPEIYVQPPSVDTKVAIALTYSHKSAKKKITPILNIVSTGLEAKMVGEIGSDEYLTHSQFSLFASFIKKKLGNADIGGFFLMALIAKLMSDKITFSLTIRVLEALLLKQAIPSKVYRKCIMSDILEERDSKVSFRHEMFFNFFVADSVARFAKDAEEILEELNAPKNANKKLMIIGSIDDQQLLDKVLGGVKDSSLFDSLLEGEGGEYCRIWTEKKINQLLLKMATEISNCRFEFAETLYHFQFVDKGLQNWSDQDLALLSTIPSRLANGDLLKEVLDLTDAMDDVCLESIKEFWEEGKERGISTRASIFSVAYFDFFQPKMSITRLFTSLHSSFFHLHSRLKIPFERLEQLVAARHLKPGQIYLLLLLLRFDNLLVVLYPTVLHILQNKWRQIPIQLLTEILQHIRYIYKSKEQCNELINAISQIHAQTQNIWLSTAIFDALSVLGGLEEDVYNHIIVAKAEIREVLNNPNDQSAWGLASGIFFRQYDHPYNAAYYTAIDELSITEKSLFLEMALQGEEQISLFTVPLIMKAFDVIGASIMPYLVKWTKNPIIESPFSQDSLAVFMIAHLLMGRNNYPLPEWGDNSTNEMENSVRTLAEIFYWYCRTDIEIDAKYERYQTLGKILFRNENSYVLDTIWQSKHVLYLQQYYDGLNLDIIGAFESSFCNEIVDACRLALIDLNWQDSIWQFGERRVEMNQQAISFLEYHGTIIDLDVLRPLAYDKVYGKYAVEAIRKLGG